MFIGIDHSLKETAITILFNPLNYNTYSFKGKGKNSHDKLADVYRQSSRLLQKAIVTYTVKMGKNISGVSCHIEGGSYGSEGKLYTLGQLSGLILSKVIDLGVSWDEVPPMLLKKFISNKGNASKKFVMQSIYTKYKVRFLNDNKADSYALALFGYRERGYLDGLSSPFREELEVISERVHPSEKKKRVRYRRTKKEF